MANHLLAALSSDYQARDFEIIAIPYTDKNKARIQLAMYAKEHKFETRTMYFIDDKDDIEHCMEAIIHKHIHTLIEDFIPENTDVEDLWQYRVSVYVDMMESIVENIRSKYPRGESRISDLTK